MMKKMVYPVILILTAMLAMTACGAASKSQTEHIAMETTAAAMEDTMEMEGRGMEETLDSAAQKAGGRPGASLNSETDGTQVLPAGRKLIRNVTMQVETDQFEKLVSGISAKIAELGGYVEQSDVSGTSMNYRGEPVPRYANMTARIPNNRLDSFVTTVNESGNVTNKSESTQDVTLQYSDVESRKKSLEIEQERIWKFLEKAETIDTVITLEQRLSDIRYQLESMESQLRLYDNQVDYSTVYLSINEVTAYTPLAPETTGTRIKNGLSDNAETLAQALTNLLVTLITTSPFWIPLLLIVLIAFAVVRRHNKKIDILIAEKKLARSKAEKNSDKNCDLDSDTDSTKNPTSDSDKNSDTGSDDDSDNGANQNSGQESDK